MQVNQTMKPTQESYTMFLPFSCIRMNTKEGTYWGLKGEEKKKKSILKNELLGEKKGHQSHCERSEKWIKEF